MVYPVANGPQNQAPIIGKIYQKHFRPALKPLVCRDCLFAVMLASAKQPATDKQMNLL